MNENVKNLGLNIEIDVLCELYEKKKFLTVIHRAKVLLKKFNNSVSLLNILGMANSKINKYQTAIGYYQEALKYNSNHSLTLFNIGVAFHDLLNFEKAIIFYKKAILTNPSYIEPVYNLSFLYKEIGQYNKSIKLLNKIISIDSNYITAYQNLTEIICEYGDIYPGDKNLEIVKKATKLSSSSISDFNTLVFYSNYLPNSSAEEVFSYYQ